MGNPVWSGIPRFITQFDGSRFSAENCTMAAAAMLVWMESNGTQLATGAQLRALSGDANQPGTVWAPAGTNLAAAKAALNRVGLSLEISLRTPYGKFQQKSLDHSSVVIGHYDFIPDQYKLQQSSWFNHSAHSVFVYKYDPQRDAYWVMDPLAQNVRDYKGSWWPSSVMRKFAWSNFGLIDGAWGNVGFQTKNVGNNTAAPPFTSAGGTGGSTAPTQSVDLFGNAIIRAAISVIAGSNGNRIVERKDLGKIALAITDLFHPELTGDDRIRYAMTLLGIGNNLELLDAQGNPLHIGGTAEETAAILEREYLGTSVSMSEPFKIQPTPVLVEYLGAIERGQQFRFADLLATKNVKFDAGVAPHDSGLFGINDIAATLQTITDPLNWAYAGAMLLGIVAVGFGLKIVLDAGGTSVPIPGRKKEPGALRVNIAETPETRAAAAAAKAAKKHPKTAPAKP